MGTLCASVRRICRPTLALHLSAQILYEPSTTIREVVSQDSALSELSSGEVTQWLRALACSPRGPQVQFSAATGQLTTDCNSSSLFWLLWALHISGAKANL